MEDKRTENLGLPLPFPENELAEDVYRISDAFTMVDACLKERIDREKQVAADVSDLRDQIHAEATSRATAESSLSQKIEAEASERAAADEAAQDMIGSLKAMFPPPSPEAAGRLLQVDQEGKYTLSPGLPAPDEKGAPILVGENGAFELGTPPLTQGLHSFYTTAGAWQWPDKTGQMEFFTAYSPRKVWRLAAAKDNYILLFIDLETPWNGGIIQPRIQWLAGAPFAAGNAVFRWGYQLNYEGPFKTGWDKTVDLTVPIAATTAPNPYIFTDLPPLDLEALPSVPKSITMYIQRIGTQAADTFGGDTIFCGARLYYSLNAGNADHD